MRTNFQRFETACKRYSLQASAAFNLNYEMLGNDECGGIYLSYVFVDYREIMGLMKICKLLNGYLCIRENPDSKEQNILVSISWGELPF